MAQPRRHAPTSLQPFWNEVIERCQAQLSIYSQAAASRDRCEREQAYEGVTYELRAIESLLPLFRTRQNALRPISQLPAETLSHIFRFCAFDDYYYHQHDLKSRPGWIPLTHVCSHWRRIACEDSLLWSCIWPDSGDEMIDMMLRRARSAPLSIKMVRDITGNNSLKFVNFISNHANRIGDLALRLSPGKMSRAIAAFSASQTLCLTALHLEVTSSSETLPSSQAFLPHNIFTAAPKLRELILFDVLIDCRQALPSSLEEFTYTLTGNLEGDHPLSVIELSSLLEKANSLKFLNLSQIQLIGWQKSSSPAVLIHLPCLEALILDCYIETCDLVLNVLRIPPACQLDIDCAHGNDRRQPPTTTFIDIASNISNHLKQRSERGSTVMKKFEVLCIEDNYVQLAGCYDLYAGEDDWDFVFKLDLTRATSQKLINTFRALNLREIISLSLSIRYCEFLAWDWPGISDIFSNVTNLSVGVIVWLDDWWPHLFETLSTQRANGAPDSIDSTPSVPSQRQAPSPMFPRLVCLEMQTEHDVRGDQREDELVRYFNALYDMLRARGEGGVGVEELHLAGVLPESIDVPGRMREVVPNVTTRPL